MPIVLLHDLYETKVVKINEETLNVTLKQYVQGIGTLKENEDDVLGSGFGEGYRGIYGKVLEGSNSIAKEISKILLKDKEIGTITFDVYGFSRGAAAARHFCNELLSESTLFFKETLLYNLLQYGYNIPTPFNYTNYTTIKDFTSIKPNFNKNTNDFKFKKILPKINIRFVGLFDTVVAQNVLKDVYNELNILKINIDDLPIKYKVHFTAIDEYRFNFPLTRIKNGFEFSMHGSHSDIGGGYPALLKENVILDLEYTEKNITPKRHLKLKEYYINKNICLNDFYNEQIRYFDKKRKSINISDDKKYIQFLISEREIKNRLSIVSFNAMKNLAETVGVKFNSEPKKNKFEYILPKDLKIYNEYIINLTEIEFKKYYKMNSINKNKIKINDKIIKKIMNKYIHLSSNYSSNILELNFLTKFIDNYFDLSDYDKLKFINIPNYCNNIKDCYKRNEVNFT